MEILKQKGGLTTFLWFLAIREEPGRVDPWGGRRGGPRDQQGPAQTQRQEGLFLRPWQWGSKGRFDLRFFSDCPLLTVKECFVRAVLTEPCDLAAAAVGSVAPQQLARAWCWSSVSRVWSCWQLYSQMARLFDSWLVPFTQKINTQISVCWAWQNVHRWWVGDYCCTHCGRPQTSVAADGLRWQRTLEFSELEGNMLLRVQLWLNYFSHMNF